MAITQTYQVDMTPGGVSQVVHVSMSEVGGERILKFVLYNGNISYIIPSGATTTIRGGKPDGTIYEYSCNIASDRKSVSIPVQSQMTAIPGIHDAEIRVYDGTNIIGSANLKIFVEKSPFSKFYRVSASELPAIETAEQAAFEAHADRNAVAAYKDQAKQSEENAANSSTSATNAANTATSKAAEAKASADAAAKSEENAMSATPEGYSALASTFNALGLSVVDGAINVTYKQ